MTLWCVVDVCHFQNVFVICLLHSLSPTLLTLQTTLGQSPVSSYCRDHRRITESFALEETFIGPWVQPSAMSRNIFHSMRLLKVPSSFGIFQGWSIHPFSGQPTPMFHHTHCKNFIVTLRDAPSVGSCWGCQLKMIKMGFNLQIHLSSLKYCPIIPVSAQDEKHSKEMG